MIMETVSEPLEHDPVTSDSDTDKADQDEEYLPGAGSSSTSSTDSPDGGEGETLPDLSWRSKNEEIHWAPTNSVSLQFNPPGTGLTAGPTRYAVARVGELTDSFDLFFTTEITKIVTEYMMLCYVMLLLLLLLLLFRLCAFLDLVLALSYVLCCCNE